MFNGTIQRAANTAADRLALLPAEWDLDGRLDAVAVRAETAVNDAGIIIAAALLTGLAMIAAALVFRDR